MASPTAAAAPTPRRRTAAALAGALVLGALSFVGTLALVPDPPAPLCPDGTEVFRQPGGLTSCAHADVAPRGVDITKPVATSVLRARPGAGPGAHEVAQELGVPSTPAAQVASPDVTCDGDGTSGYRTQAMYVVEANATNRFASLKSTMQVWAAGIDDVVNRSAALTGGVRHVRYVTEAGGGGCVAKVLNVTVPAGSMANFNATINAVKALGYDNPARKYMMWTDTSGKGICGIAVTYPYDTDGQGNPNNGSYPQYTRTDSPCWGLGNNDYDHSVEAHELVHTFGSVMKTAPHGTRNGHCWDESDTMCYADGGGFAMKQVCPTNREYLLDCNADDYFSTYPDPGSWLDTHWNVADSRFLIGGGNGTGGGSSGTPSVLGATIGVNNPAVPGLSTQVTVTPSLPTGRTLASAAWKAARADCTFSTPTAVQSDVTCSAAVVTNTLVTATLVDSTGAKKVVSSPLTFATNTARPVTAVLKVDGQSSASGGTASACTGATTPVTVTLTDTATGQPIKGLAPTLAKTTGSKTTTTTLAASKDDGVATSSHAMLAATSFSAATKATKVYAAASAVTKSAAVAVCTPELTATASTLAPWYGDAVTVSGTLTRDVAGVDVPLSGVSLPVTATTSSVVKGKTVTKVTSLGSAKTTANGSFSLTTKPLVNGTLKVALATTKSWTGSAVTLGDLDVKVPTTSLAGAVDKTDVGHGQTVAVTGTLTKATGSAVGVLGATVSVRVTTAGKTTQVGTGRTTANGSYSIPVVLKQSGELSVAFAGVAGLPAASDVVDDVTAGTWTTTLSTPTATPTTVGVAKPSVITGTLTRTYQGVTEPARGTLTVAVAPTTGAAGTVKVTTAANGTFTLKVSPKVTTTYTVRLLGLAGHADTAATPVKVTVS
ncbi:MULTISPECIES: hypothetical protein [unclassified Nocardioides]|uniref:hypothetical protein n=1 Tax=unclassified Nocardioides TaxID=2615069 RepID=UPI003014FB21